MSQGHQWSTLFTIFSLFWHFLQILPQLKTFPKNLSVRIILVLDATVVPNLTFLGLLSPEISFGENPPRHPAYFASRGFVNGKIS